MQFTPTTLGNILAAGRIAIHFQPVVSIKQRTVFAVEALARGIPDNEGPLVPPNVLFQSARGPEELLALDRLCRVKALEAFSRYHQAQPNLLLSLNLDARSLSREIVGSEHLRRSVAAHGVDPGNVIIEIIESRALDIESLIRFVDIYRGYGFLVALDDVGSGHSNLDRIPLLKPDIIKIDRALISGIDTIYHKQEITKSLVGLCTKIGALPVAEGVENEAEVLRLMELGVDLFQGYHFARPDPVFETNKALGQRIADTATSFKRQMVRTLNERKRRHLIYNNVIDTVTDRLSKVGPEAYDGILEQALDLNSDLECLYILDTFGQQMSSTICSEGKPTSLRRLLYQPAVRGADHSLKEYFLPLTAGLTRYTTECYISLASGNLCQTISALFTDGEGVPRILCLDVHHRENCSIALSR